MRSVGSAPGRPARDGGCPRAGGWRRTLLAGLVVLVSALAGCGVPSESSVVEGGGPGLAEAPAFGDDGTNEPDGRAATVVAGDFVQNYLASAAGEREEAVRRARDFFVPDQRTSWSPPPEVQVIHVRTKPIVDRTALGYEVQVPATVLGELGENGAFVPQVAKDVTYRFSIADNVEGETGLFLSAAPSIVLLSDEALQRYFELRTIYFWSTDHRVLVPDLRYLPRRDVPMSQRATLIIDWLLRGPAEWLKPVVEPLPLEARAIGKVPARDDGVVKVVLSKAVAVDDPVAVNRLATQLRWSLRSPNNDPKLELKVDQSQWTFNTASYLEANPAYRGRRDPVRFCVFRGEVRQLGSRPVGAPAVPEIPAKWNRQVVRAALASENGRTAAAVIRTGSNGKLVLDVGGGNGSIPALRRTDLQAGWVSQPAWIPGGSGLGLVVADGKLVSFRAAGGPVQQVINSPAGITAFALAPDGRRIAYVAQGRLFVAALPKVGSALRVGDPRQVPTTLRELTAVGWSQQDWLLIAGRQADGLVALLDITVDGAAQAEPRGGQNGTQPVSHLTTVPGDPGNGPIAGQSMYVVSGLSYELFRQSRPIMPSEVSGTDGSATPGRGTTNPTFPFFLE